MVFLGFERSIHPDAPAGELLTPEIGAAQAEPFRFPKLIGEIQHHPTVNLIDVIHVQLGLGKALPEVSIKSRPTVVPADMQFAIE